MTLNENCSEAVQAAKNEKDKKKRNKKEKTQSISGVEICQWEQKLPGAGESCYSSAHQN